MNIDKILDREQRQGRSLRRRDRMLERKVSIYHKVYVKHLLASIAATIVAAVFILYSVITEQLYPLIFVGIGIIVTVFSITIPNDVTKAFNKCLEEKRLTDALIVACLHRVTFLKDLKNEDANQNGEQL